MATNLIRNIWGVGRNYADHAKELGNAVPTEPMIFLKAGSTILESESVYEFPTFTSDIHHEVELAVQFGEDLKITHAAVALDLTAREVQNGLKKAGHPWTLAKSFKDSTLLGPLYEVKSEALLSEMALRLLVNDEVRQEGRTKDMIFSVPKLAQYLRERFPVCPGDLILTGTPSGVGPLSQGDRIEASCYFDPLKPLSLGRWNIG